MEIEDNHLMPIILARFGQPRGPASVLRSEHQAILELLETLCSTRRVSGGRELTRGLVQTLDVLLRGHGHREEELVYAIADKCLDDEERASLIDFCRAWR